MLHACDGEHDDERKSYSADDNLREGHVGGLKEKEHERKQKAVEGQGKSLCGDISSAHYHESAHGNEQKQKASGDLHAVLSFRMNSTPSCSRASQWSNWRVRMARAVA